MKIIILDNKGNVRTIEGDAVPRVGDQVDMGYIPAPTVTDVLWYPEDEDFIDMGTIAAVTVK